MTGFFFDEGNATSAFESRFSLGPRAGFGENLVLQGRAQTMADNSSSAQFNLANAYDPIIAALNEGKSGRQRNWRAVIGNPYGRTINDPLYGPEWRAYNSAEEIEAEVWRRVQERRAVDPTFLSEGPKDRNDLLAQVKQSVLDAIEEAESAGARATPLGDVGGFLGRMGASIVDPPNVLTSFFGAPASSSILRLAVVEGLIGAATEAGIQVDVAAYRRRLGLDYTTRDFVTNVVTAGAGGVLLGGAVAGGIRLTPKARDAIESRFFKNRAVGRALLEAVETTSPEEVARGLARLNRRELAEAFDALVTNPTDEQALAREALQNQIEIAEANPLEDTPAGRAEHLRRLVETSDAVQHGEPSRLEDVPRAERELQQVLEVDNLDSLVWRFDPEEIEVDAELFQFKGGGDDFGVTERLQGVTKWDPVKAGLVLVYEFRDGRRFIADGHQRVGLARRIKAQDPKQDVALFGVLLREADGVTPQQARAIAAAKNIAEGTGTPVDAAKVLQASPELLAELPPRSTLVRTARELTELAPEAFGMVVNEIVPYHFAALVGRLAPIGGSVDTAFQMAVLQQLARAEPANRTQAEAMIRQMIEVGGDRRRQASLFGEELVFESLLQERAKILDRAITQLRQDRSVFSTLTREQDRIEAEGNQLAAERNTRRAERDGQALELIQILANRRGGLSDDLTAAARRAREERRFDRAIGDFVDSVRRRVDQGDFDGLLAGATGRDREAETSAGRGPTSDESVNLRGPGAEQRSLEPFADPAGEGQSDQVEFLAGEVADEAQSVTPSSARSSADAGAPRITAETSAPPGIQAPSRQVSTRELPSGISTSRETDPLVRVGSTRIFGDFSLGAIDDTSNRKILQGSSDFNLLLETAAEVEPVFRGRLEDLTAAVRGAEVFGTRVKDRPGLEEKINQGRPAQTVSDYLGGRIWIEGLEDLVQLRDLVGRSFRVIDFDDFLDTPKLGYRATHMQLDLGNGMSAELQLVPRAIGEVQEQAHKIYDKWKRKTELTAEETRALQADRSKSERIFEAAWKKSAFAKATKRPITERIAEGIQSVIPGAERISDRALAERRGRAPLRPQAPQRPADEGLFDVAGRGQADLLDLVQDPEANLDFEVPIGRGFDANGNEVPTTRPARDLLADVGRDQEFLEQLDLCNTGGGS